MAPSGTPPFKTGYGNFAPRIGVAYQLSQNLEWGTVLRGGFGVFYDLATSEVGNLIDQNVYPYGSTQFCLSSFQLPGCPSTLTFPLDPATAAPPPIAPPDATNQGTLAAFDPHLKLPYTLQWNAALEQALGRKQTISVSYIGAAGRRLIQTAEVFPANPNIGGAFLVANTATSDYQALQLQFQRRLSHGLQVLSSYTWSHSIDDASAGSVANTTNIFVPSINPSANRGPSDFDIRNAFSAGITYDVPAPKINAFTNAVLRGWSLQSLIQARSATPVDVSDQNFFGAFNNGFNGDVRPDLVPGQPLYLFGAQYPGGKAFNAAAFADPPADPNTGNPLRDSAKEFPAWVWSHRMGFRAPSRLSDP